LLKLQPNHQSKIARILYILKSLIDNREDAVFATMCIRGTNRPEVDTVALPS